MLRKVIVSCLLAALFVVAGCRHAKVQNPIAHIDSKQPDKVLFDRAMESMKKGRYTEARTLLDTLLTTYPDSEYVARAKLAKGDAWYAEGGTAGLQQAEVEYKDFITFFPNMPEAAEAQYKVATIHYKQMEKPDRDFTQAMRAADEYKIMIQQFPDSKLIPEAKQRLREVQEILADRQWRIAHFYFLRNNLAASQARLSSLVDSYPLYSGADEALFLLGSIYEKEATAMRVQKKVPEGLKAKLSQEYDQKAIETYTRLINRYPIMGRADDARRRLQALKAAVPKPTAEAIAQNQSEEDSRGDTTRFHQLVNNFRKHPDVSKTSDVGDPNLEEEEIVGAPALIQQFNAELASGANTQKTAVESAKVGTGPAPGPNQPAPGTANTQPANQPASGNADGGPNQPSSNELPVVPSGAATSSSSSSANTAVGNTGAASTAAPNSATPPKQINDIGATSDSSPQNASQTTQNGQQSSSDNQDSSSKKKKKKGLHKLIPF